MREKVDSKDWQDQESEAKQWYFGELAEIYNLEGGNWKVQEQSGEGLGIESPDLPRYQWDCQRFGQDRLHAG